MDDASLLSPSLCNYSHRLQVDTISTMPRCRLHKTMRLWTEQRFLPREYKLTNPPEMLRRLPIHYRLSFWALYELVSCLRHSQDRMDSALNINLVPNITLIVSLDALTMHSSKLHLTRLSILFQELTRRLLDKLNSSP